MRESEDPPEGGKLIETKTVKGVKTTTFRIYVLNPRKKGITVALSDNKIKLLKLTFGFTSDTKIRKFLCQTAQNTLENGDYKNFEYIKRDCEDQKHFEEIIDSLVVDHINEKYKNPDKEIDADLLCEIRSLITTEWAIKRMLPHIQEISAGLSALLE